MPKCIMLVGPPGSGKSTLAKQYTYPSNVKGDVAIYVNQDSQGKHGHQEIFRNALYYKHDIVVDRMNFNKQQRASYIAEARKHGYYIEIIVLHQPYAVCLDRVLKRIGKHETIVDEKGARAALQTFFTKYERPEPGEADKITFIYPEGPKSKVIVCDLDGTLCNVEHRRHFVRPPADFYIKTLGELEPVDLDRPLPVFKKNWPAFFAGIKDDTVNQWCADILKSLSDKYGIVYCSGRGDNERKATEEWLYRHDLDRFGKKGSIMNAPLYMRNRHDSRQDSIVKEIILDFEILCRYEPVFMIDDRKQVVDMWRKRGFVCLQCDVGDF